MPSTDKPNQLEKNKTFNEPYTVNQNIVVNPSVKASQEVYPLDYYEYELIKKSETHITSLAINLISGVMAVGLLLLTRHELSNKIEEYEWWAFVITLIASIIFLLISYKVSTKRKKIFKKIDEHFEKNPRRIEYHKEKSE